jgi:hypothetical protein
MHFYSQSELVQSKDISVVVTALDTNLDHELKKVAAGLSQYFSANPVAKGIRWSTVRWPSVGLN